MIPLRSCLLVSGFGCCCVWNARYAVKKLNNQKICFSDQFEVSDLHLKSKSKKVYDFLVLIISFRSSHKLYLTKITV